MATDSIVCAMSKRAAITLIYMVKTIERGEHLARLFYEYITTTRLLFLRRNPLASLFGTEAGGFRRTKSGRVCSQIPSRFTARCSTNTMHAESVPLPLYWLCGDCYIFMFALLHIFIYAPSARLTAAAV